MADTAQGTPKLTARQRVFCQEYAACLNATKAALRAGYSEKSANEIGSQNLAKLHIRTYIDQLLDEKTLKPQEVLARLAEHANSDMGDFYDASGQFSILRAKELGLSRLIKKITYKDGEISSIELHDSQAALAHLGRAYSLFTDKQEVDNTGEITIKVVRADDNA